MKSWQESCGTGPTRHLKGIRDKKRQKVKTSSVKVKVKVKINFGRFESWDQGKAEVKLSLLMKLKERGYMSREASINEKTEMFFWG